LQIKNHSSRWDGFIMYHQVNELILKWYFGKCAKFPIVKIFKLIFLRRLMRISRYFDITTSFSIMGRNGSRPVYEIRNTLTPAVVFKVRSTV
jgi:tryptophan 2,3-dioxygenase